MKRDFHIFITPYLCKFVILILHTILLITVIALMCINKLTSILFYKWTEFMNIIGRKRVILDRESEKPYMERYYLLFTERDNYFPFNIFIKDVIGSKYKYNLFKFIRANSFSLGSCFSSIK